MKRTISPGTRVLIDSLGQSSDWEKRLSALRPELEILRKIAATWEKRLSALRPELEILRKIAATGEFAAIPEIVSFVLSNNQEVSHAAVSAIDQLLCAAPSSELAWLDQRMRELSPYLGRHRLRWHQLRPLELNRFEVFGSASLSLLGVASFHSNGYVREEAVRRLAQVMDGTELPFLLIRLNDWVDEIRRATHSFVQVRLNSSYAGHFVAHLSLLDRLRQVERNNHYPLIEAIEALLKKAECQAALRAGCASPDRFTRRASFRLAADSAEGDLANLLEGALNDHDTMVQLWAARKAISAFEGEKCLTLLSRLKRHRLMPVRREALRALFAKFPQQATEELQAALLDSHASIREEAYLRLSEAGPFNFSGFYRDAVTSGKESSLAAAISGLGVMGLADDAHLVHPHVNHLRPKVRKAAVQALARLDRDSYLNVFIESLLDHSPSVSAEAAKALRQRARQVGGNRLWDVFTKATSTRTKFKVLTLLAKLDKWESIPFLIRAAGDSNEEIAGAAKISLELWLRLYNRQFSQPTGAQRESLKSAFGEC